MNNAKTLSSYLSELEDVWQLAHQKARQQIESKEIPMSLVDCVHNALLRSSLNTFAENLTPKIVARLYETDLWTVEDVLSLVSIIPDNYRKAQSYIALLETGKLDAALTVKVRNAAFETAQSIDFPAYRSWAMEELSKYTDAEHQYDALEKAIDAAIDYADSPLYSIGGNNGYELCLIIEKLPTPLLGKTEEKILALKNAEARAWALAYLARRTSGNRQYQLLAEGLEAVSRIKPDVNIANALAQLANQLSGELVPKALDLALAIKEGNWRPRAIAGLMDKLDQSQVKGVLEHILPIEDEWWRADGLISVVEHSSSETQLQALQNLLSIEDGEPYSKMISWLRNFTITQTNVDIAIHAASEIKNNQHRLKMLQRLNSMAHEKQVQDQPLSFPSLIDQSNQYITVKNTVYDRLENIFQIEWEEERANELASFVSLIPDELIPLVVERAKKFFEWLNRDKVLKVIAPRLTPETLAASIDGVADYEDTTSMVEALKHLAPYLDQPQKETVLSYALDTILAIGEPNWRTADPLFKLRSELDGDLWEKATIHLPDELKNTTYEELSAKRHAETMKRFEEDPQSKRQFEEFMKAGREHYEAHQASNPAPLIPEPLNPVTELLENLSNDRNKKRESIFWLCRAITQLVADKTLSPAIIPAIAADILDIHKNWHWP
jgi:hypothetical protein